ncbi:hypothetical protein Rhe02_65250 [Rhizocola hellebori]|uniref:Uncharacterized protein n=1 Tax=Rhizocola hellebori TaxID=1392758 RepID=A0A8J3VJY5_9ACTN|nr:hypothetical protein [Rhizocola hellebori]GIH08458.1 hypothetical protein Rhe02_65250 [Rhizocola hellebori]
MALQFVDRTEVRSIDQLSEVQREQLRLSGVAYDGQDLPAQARLAEGSVDEGPSFLGFCEHWRIVDGDRYAFDAWMYMVDSGTFFRAGTTEQVAEIIQFGLECDDPQLRLQLGAAMVQAQQLPKADSSYQEFAAHLDHEDG